MSSARQVLRENVRLLRGKASKQAIVGTIIALATVAFATLLSAYLSSHALTVAGILHAQRSNPVLWVLEATPFIFAFWGQHTSTVIAYEAGAMIVDQTSDLRTQTATLENRISHESTHDRLTNLPNRVLFVDRLEQALQLAHSEGSKVGVLLLDLDGFKEINDTLGHHSGDRVLKSVAMRIRNAVSESVTVARMAGDEFALILPRLNKEEDEALTTAASIRTALEAPYTLEGISLGLAASIGATVYPAHGRDAYTLMQRAETAMYWAKKEQRGYTLYSPERDKSNPHRLILLGELRQTIQRQELLLDYQPIVAAGDGRLQGVEALVRWQHERYGLLLPDEFIPFAERSGFIHEVTTWVLRNALRSVAAWQHAGLALYVSVNVTAASLLDPEFANTVAGMLASLELPRDTLILEMTETTLLTDQERALETIARLSELGVRTVIDDFGTGYSSLAYLRKLPVSGIKIDRSFVADMANDDGGEVLINAIVRLAHALKLHVTAEGVENDGIAARLPRLGCDALQGYAIARPMPAPRIAAWYARHKITARI